MTWRRTAAQLLDHCAAILFLRGPLAGATLLAVTFLVPRVGLGGVTAVAAGVLFTLLAGAGRRLAETPYVTYNALFVGLSVGYLVLPLSFAVALAAVGGTLAAATALALNGALGYHFKLPALSLPFVLVSSALWVALHASAHLATPAAVATLSLPWWIERFLIALGAVLFTPQPLAGLVLALLILRHSRLLFLLAVAGFYLGAAVDGLLLGSLHAGLYDVNGFNFMLVAMALGGIYLVPAPRSYAVAALAVAGTAVVTGAMRLTGGSGGEVPPFTLPFNLVTLGFLYGLGWAAYPWINARPGAAPEESLEAHLDNRRRFGPPLPQLALPFAGTWAVWQGFDGPWTHRGAWAHAFDFVVSRDGRTHSGRGERLEEFYAWNRPVLAPCAGRVVRVIGHLPDNPPGEVDLHENWGNLVIIENAAGACICLAHFAAGSIEVVVGQWVEAGARLGRCGNSGYSPQPHIHLQVQRGAAVGAPTLPFRLAGYVAANRFHARGLPAAGTLLEPWQADTALARRLAFPPATRLVLRRFSGGQRGAALTLTAAIDEGGESCLQGEAGRLYYTQDAHSFYTYRLEGSDPALALLFRALPRLPLRLRHGLHWHEALPLSVAISGWRRHLVSFVRAFRPHVGQSEYRGSWAGDGSITGTVTAPFGGEQPVEVVLDPRLGFARVRVGEEELRLEAFHYGTATPQTAGGAETAPATAPLTAGLLKSA